MDLKSVDDALNGVRVGLEADGFRLVAQEVADDGNVVVRLEAGDATCLDCLVPDAMLEQILDQAIKSEVPGVTQTSLVKVGFEGLESH